MCRELDDKFVNSIAKLVDENDVQILEDSIGREYFSKDVIQVEPALPKVQELSTLDGLVDMIEAEDLKCSVFISGPNKVYLRSKLDDKWKQREVFAVSSAYSCDFPFGREMTIEDFIIKLQCNFVETDDKRSVLRAVSSITTSEVTTADDDGLAQTVVTKAAVGHKMQQVKLDPIVKLKPFRTFSEISQPEDTFLLRIHREKGCLPSVSLRAAGGHQWEVKAVRSIYEYMKARVPDGIAVIR